MPRTTVAWIVLAASAAPVAWAGAVERHAAFGVLLELDRAHRTVVVSCQEIPGFMDAMVMPFTVRHAKELDGLAANAMIDFTVVAETKAMYAENIRVHPYAASEQQPFNAEQLKLLEKLTDAPVVKELEVGESVPDFTLIDQAGQNVQLSQQTGKVVAISFMYTKCRLANYCFRLSNNLGMLQKRFADRLGRDLILLTITFDPANDDPETLARYAATWKADAKTWHFLTGPPDDVQRVCRQFGMDFWPNMGMLTHTMRTIVVDREGRVAARLEGNEFSARQLGDLVGSVLKGTPARNAER